MNTIKSKKVSCCPICYKEAKQRGRNGLILCLMHSWVKGIRGIEITHTNQGRA